MRDSTKKKRNPSGLSKQTTLFALVVILVVATQIYLIIFVHTPLARTPDLKFEDFAVPMQHTKSRRRDSWWIDLPNDFRPDWHNVTVDGKPMPGPFWDERLYLIGARLTTSYEKDDLSVHATLFGMGGDPRVRGSNVVACSDKRLMGENGTLWTFQDLAQKVRLYVSLTTNATTMKHYQYTNQSLTLMKYIPTISWDPNSNDVRGDLL
jgi:hypothetical protein